MGKIGPHEGKELELMLSGSKNVSFFSQLETYQNFEKALIDGQVIKILEYYNTIPLLIYTLPNMVNDGIELLQTLKQSLTSPSKNIDRKIGEILGYSNEDINLFIENNYKN